MENSNCLEKLLEISDIGINYYLNHVWIVDLNSVSRHDVTKVARTLNNQGCVTITINVASSFEEICDQFRSVISQISSCSLILIIITHFNCTNKDLLLNIVGYLRCCQMNILYTGSEIPDASMASMQEVVNMVGELSIKFGYDDMDDISLNSGSMSNSLRYNSISWAKYMKEEYSKKGVIYVGWHLLSYIFGMELGIKMTVYEMTYMQDPEVICKGKMSKLSQKTINKNPLLGYMQPNAKVKLGALFSWSLLKYDTIIVIGGYPGKELRRMHKFIDAYHKKVFLIDPQFHKSKRCDSVEVIKGTWNFDSNICENLSNFNIALWKKTIIVDDAWVSEGKWNFLQKKLQGLYPMDNVDVSIKFNWYSDSKDHSIWVNNLCFNMLTPGINDSTESRLVLHSNSYGHRIEKSDYLQMMYAWKSFSMAEQCFMFGYYFGEVMKEINILNETIHELKEYIVVSLYALGNVKSNMKLDTLSSWSDNGIYFLTNLYSDLNNFGHVAVHKQYRDIIYKFTDILKLYNSEVYSLTVDKLYNILYIKDLSRHGFKLIGNLNNIKKAVNEANKRILICNFELPTDVKYQSSLFSFASRLKWITVKLRISREIGMNTTYLLRYNLIFKLFGTNCISYNSTNHGVILNTSKGVKVTFSIFSGRRMIHLSDYISTNMGDEILVEVSGHVLNLIMWEILEPGNLMLWLKQIIFYYRNLTANGNRNDKTRNAELKRLWMDGYFIETSLDRLNKKWHSKLEMLLACAIAKDYWDGLLRLTPHQLALLDGISQQVFEIFLNGID